MINFRLYKYLLPSFQLWYIHMHAKHGGKEVLLSIQNLSLVIEKQSISKAASLSSNLF